jgi:hypothetical protein
VKDGGAHQDLAASWKAEKCCFRWTVGFTTGLCLLILGWVGAVLWFNHQFKSSLAKPGAMNLDGVGSFVVVISVLNILILILGLCFLVSLTRWLLAIRGRRKMQVRVGFQPGENR